MIQGTQYGFYTAATVEEMEAYDFPENTHIICYVGASPSVTFKGINGAFKQISLPGFTGNNGKVLKLVDGVLVFETPSEGSFSGTMDDIDDGVTYVKTENNYTDADVSKLEGIATNATLNDTDSNLKNRTNHEGEQAISTVTGLQTALDGKSATGHNHTAVYEPAKGADDNFVTDAEKVKLGNLSGTNSGDQDISVLALKATTLTINGTAQDLSANRNWTINGGDIVYAPTPGDVPINNAADQTIATKGVTGIVSGDQIIMEGEFIILNNSTATRVYVITLDFDNAFDIEITTPAMATSATLMHPFMFRAVCNVRSSSLAYAVVSLDMQLAAGIASGTDTTMAATHLSGKGWGTSASDLTGTLTCDLKIRSANNTATQTCRLVSFTVRKTNAVG